jgi:hypothetical protein
MKKLLKIRMNNSKRKRKGRRKTRRKRRIRMRKTPHRKKTLSHPQSSWMKSSWLSRQVLQFQRTVAIKLFMNYHWKIRHLSQRLIALDKRSVMKSSSLSLLSSWQKKWHLLLYNLLLILQGMKKNFNKSRNLSSRRLSLQERSLRELISKLINL